ncbi:MFS transporter [Oceanicella sp. SM1341]|uniref:MFS transporter n=1 Tax=Oceanicella sp. SM1341 TaxID=1548889 RepID=UPI0018E52CCE|nr:MFS transporter [Oceanicella sp. SM1341]
MASPLMLGLLTASAALVAAGSYFAQPIAYTISDTLGISSIVAGFVVTVGQIGYVIGLLFLMPLGDLIEIRRFLSVLLVGSIACLVAIAIAPNSTTFFVACLGIGISSVSVQILVMLAAFMSSSERRGQAVGTVTGGLLIGILLAWPVATFVSARLGWRALYGLDALVFTILATALRRSLPSRRVHTQQRYVTLVRSLSQLWVGEPELRHRAIRQALLFFGFSLYWTTVPVELREQNGLGPNGIALFGLIGGAGALVAVSMQQQRLRSAISPGAG